MVKLSITSGSGTLLFRQSLSTEQVLRLIEVANDIAEENE